MAGASSALMVIITNIEPKKIVENDCPVLEAKMDYTYI